MRYLLHRSDRGALLAALLAAVIVVSVACGSDASVGSSEPVAEAVASTEPATPAEEPTVMPAEEPTPEPADDRETAASPSGGLALRLQAAIDEWAASTVAPGGAVAVQLADGTRMTFVAGTADLATGTPVTEASVFRIASISKSVTAALIVDLAEDGIIDLDAPVVDYLGDAWIGQHPSSSEITVRQLLGHTSGLVEYAFNPAFGVEALQRYGQAWQPSEILAFVGDQGAAFAPGTAFSYNTGGYIAAGLVAEAVTGERVADLMRDRIFDPAAAVSAALSPQDPLSPDHVHGYVDGGLRQLLVAADPADDEGLTLANGTPVIDVLAVDQANMRSSGWTGGGIEATMSATAAVWQAMFDGTILGEQAQRELLTPLTSTPYGLGVRLSSANDTQVYSHSGGTAGFRSEAGYLEGPGASFAISVTTSAAGHRIEALTAEVVTALADLPPLDDQPAG